MKTEMNLTARQIRLIAFEVASLEVSHFNAKVSTYLSARVQNFLFIAKGDTSYVLGRCHFLTYGKIAK